jgi:hypothetical protein
MWSSVEDWKYVFAPPGSLSLYNVSMAFGFDDNGQPMTTPTTQRLYVGLHATQPQASCNKLRIEALLPPGDVFLTPSVTAAQLRAGTASLDLILPNDQYAFAQELFTQEGVATTLLSAFTSVSGISSAAQAGWYNEVRELLLRDPLSRFEQRTDQWLVITLPAVPDYRPTTDEYLMFTLPSITLNPELSIPLTYSLLIRSDAISPTTSGDIFVGMELKPTCKTNGTTVRLSASERASALAQSLAEYFSEPASRWSVWQADCRSTCAIIYEIMNTVDGLRSANQLALETAALLGNSESPLVAANCINANVTDVSVQPSSLSANMLGSGGSGGSDDKGGMASLITLTILFALAAVVLLVIVVVLAVMVVVMWKRGGAGGGSESGETGNPIYMPGMKTDGDRFAGL